MKSTVETLSPTRVRLAIEVPFEELKPSLDATCKKIGAQVKVPGFRPGKVPARVIDQRVGRAAVLEEAINVSRLGVPSVDVVTQLEQNSALGEVLASGFRALNANPRCSEDDLRSTMEGTGRVVAHRLERYLNALATIASAAPLMGLFGTVVGMIEIFGSQSPAGGATGGNPAQLAHGISVALYNTAFGLIIAIPSLIFWRYFRAQVDEYLMTLELASERLVRHLNQLRRP